MVLKRARAPRWAATGTNLSGKQAAGLLSPADNGWRARSGWAAHLGQAGVAVANGEAVEVHDPAPRLHRPLLPLLLCLLRRLLRRLLWRRRRLLRCRRGLLLLRLLLLQLAAWLALQLTEDRGELVL